jgi:hypothetical protein
MAAQSSFHVAAEGRSSSLQSLTVESFTAWSAKRPRLRGRALVCACRRGPSSARRRSALTVAGSSNSHFLDCVASIVLGKGTAHGENRSPNDSSQLARMQGIVVLDDAVELAVITLLAVVSVPIPPKLDAFLRSLLDELVAQHPDLGSHRAPIERLHSFARGGSLRQVISSMVWLFRHPRAHGLRSHGVGAVRTAHFLCHG